MKHISQYLEGMGQNKTSVVIVITKVDVRLHNQLSAKHRETLRSSRTSSLSHSA